MRERCVFRNNWCIMDHEFEAMRKIVLENLRLLIEIAGRGESRLVQKNLAAIYNTVDGLPERAHHNELPEQAIRIILNDARLDSLILLADMKVRILYAHQEALAPTEKLRAEVRSSMENPLNWATGDTIHGHRTSQENIEEIEHDLRLIQGVERAFHSANEEL